MKFKVILRSMLMNTVNYVTLEHSTGLNVIQISFSAKKSSKRKPQKCKHPWVNQGNVVASKFYDGSKGNTISIWYFPYPKLREQ